MNEILPEGWILLKFNKTIKPTNCPTENRHSDPLSKFPRTVKSAPCAGFQGLLDRNALFTVGHCWGLFTTSAGDDLGKCGVSNCHSCATHAEQKDGLFCDDWCERKSDIEIFEQKLEKKCRQAFKVKGYIFLVLRLNDQDYFYFQFF